MLNDIYQSTKEYINSMPKNIRKKYGQFFTDINTAKYMSNFFDLDGIGEIVRVLDPGAGTGILSCALLERLEKDKKIKKIELVCYENDIRILSLLEKNLKCMKDNIQLELEYSIINEDYILNQNFDSPDLTFDLIIGNPPYLKISSSSKEAVHMKKICYGAPNLYFLFLAMSINNLEDDAELVYIIPRSWTSGIYFEKFREYMLSKTTIEKIHLFVSRKKVFNSENILQETIIIHLRKGKKNKKNICIYSSNEDCDIFDATCEKIPYNIVVNLNGYIFLPTCEDEIKVLNIVSKFSSTLIKNDMKMKTGLVVDFRNRELLFSNPAKNRVPIIYGQNIKDGEIKFPIKEKPNYISNEKKGLIQRNSNYLIIKRFSSKEEQRRLQCAILKKDYFSNYDYISTQNKVNFITGINHDLTLNEVFGLYCLFNSTIYDTYYRILNGTTQVNSTELNKIPIPNINTIKLIGERIKKLKNLSVKNCDKVLEEFI